MFLSMEDWICWIVAMPFSLIATSISGLIGGYLWDRIVEGIHAPVSERIPFEAALYSPVPLIDIAEF